MEQDSMEFKYDPRLTSSHSHYNGAEFQLRQPNNTSGGIREVKEDEIPSTSLISPYGTTETDFDAFFEDATSIMAIHAGETHHPHHNHQHSHSHKATTTSTSAAAKANEVQKIKDYITSKNENDIFEAFASIKTGDVGGGLNNSNNNSKNDENLMMIGGGGCLNSNGIKQAIKKEASEYEYLQTVEHYLKNRSVSPSAYFGARHIVIEDEGFENRGGPPNINLEPLKQIDSRENKKTFMERMRSAIRSTQLFPKKEEEVEVAINETQFNDDNVETSGDWCHIHYYEFSDRVGEIFKAIHPIVTIDGLCAPSDSTRLCLGAVGNPNRDPVAVAARRQIGKGCKIIYENDNVIIESNSDAAIFIQSPIHAKFRKDHLATVYRLPANHRMEVFHNKLFTELLEISRNSNDFNQVYYLQSMCHVRMSFVKGWGERYRRQQITSTPCWVELHLPIPLKAVDQTLKLVSGPTNEVHSDT